MPTRPEAGEGSLRVCFLLKDKHRVLFHGHKLTTYPMDPQRAERV